MSKSQLNSKWNARVACRPGLRLHHVMFSPARCHAEPCAKEIGTEISLCETAGQLAPLNKLLLA